MKGRRAWMRAAAGALCALVVWIAYKATSMRRMGHAPAHAGCASDAGSVADVGTLAPGTPPIRCEPWDIGTGVAGYVWHAPRPRAALLFEHGWGDYSERYASHAAALIPQLLIQGVSVYAIDMRGNGRSPGIRGATDVDAAVDDHLAARQHLRAQRLPVFLFGHSIGGLVTATSVVRDQAEVPGIVLVAPTLDWGLGAGMRAIGRTGAFLLPTFRVPGPPPDPAAQSRDAVFNARLAEDSRHVAGNITWLTAGSGAARAHANWEHYARLTVPVLLINGTGDAVTPPDGNRRFIERIASPDKTLRLLEGGRHALLDDPPAAFEAVRIILTWLEARLPGSAGAAAPTAASR